MNWGKGITVVYIGFVILIGSLVYITTQQKFDLVSEDYYDQELKFQEKINANKNAEHLSEQVSFTLTENNLILGFPSQLDYKTLSGNLHGYKSSDSKMDVRINLKPDETGKQLISRDKFSPGKYTLKLSFKNNGTDYYLEKEINF